MTYPDSIFLVTLTRLDDTMDRQFLFFCRDRTEALSSMYQRATLYIAQMKEEFKDAKFVIEQKDQDLEVDVYAVPNMFGDRRRTHTLLANQIFSWDLIEK